MGLCIYCDRAAGFLRRSHRQCRAAYVEGVREIAATMADATCSIDETVRRIEALAGRHRVRDRRFERALAKAWAGRVKAELRAGGVHRAEAERLDAILERFGKRRQDVDRGGRLWNRVLGARREAAERQVAELMRKTMRAGEPAVEEPSDAAGALADIEAAARDGGIGTAELRDVLVGGIELAIDDALADGLLTAEEERGILAVADHFAIDHGVLDRNDAWTRLIKASVLRDLADGIVPQRRLVDRSLPFRLQKSETLIWSFANVAYATMRTRREFRGRSTGMSVRVAKGVYFRTGAFKGHPVETEEQVHLDTGILGITTRHIYFAGSTQRFRVRHDRVVTIEPYSNGIGIMRDRARAKPETFVLGDGWFAYNLLRNIEVP